MKSDAGHIVVRVEPGGVPYRVIIVTDEDESGRVKGEHGAYPSAGR